MTLLYLMYINNLKERGIGLRSLKESINTTSSSGKLMLHIFGALAEFERDLIRERTTAGLEAAKRRGVKLGRPTSLTEKQIKMAKKMLTDPDITASQVAEQFGVHRATIYRAIERS